MRCTRHVSAESHSKLSRAHCCSLRNKAQTWGLEGSLTVKRLQDRDRRIPICSESGAMGLHEQRLPAP